VLWPATAEAREVVNRLKYPPVGHRCSSLPAPGSPSPADLTATITARSRDTLNKARAKHPDMVLLHGGSPKGAERIAACCWADSRKVPQIAFKPDWARHAKAAPFTGIQDNLADKAKRLGIPVWRFTGGGA